MPVLPETSGLDMRGDNVFLDVIDASLGITDGMMTVGTVCQLKLNHTIDRSRFCAGHANVTHFPTGCLGML
jgi:hypothetical protein